MKDKFIVYLNGVPKMEINDNLLIRQSVEDNLELIKSLHVRRLELEEFMEVLEIAEDLQLADKEYTEIEFLLQDAWGFSRDANFHRFWRRPKCKCPILDNEEYYGTKYAIINSNCPLHGEVDA